MSDDRFDEPEPLPREPRLEDYPYDPSAKMHELQGLDKLRATDDPVLRKHCFALYFAAEKQSRRFWYNARDGYHGPEAQADTARYKPAEVTRRHAERQALKRRKLSDQRLRDAIAEGDEQIIKTLGPKKVRELMGG